MYGDYPGLIHNKKSSEIWNVMKNISIKTILSMKLSNDTLFSKYFLLCYNIFLMTMPLLPLSWNGTRKKVMFSCLKVLGPGSTIELSNVYNKQNLTIKIVFTRNLIPKLLWVGQINGGTQYSCTRDKLFVGVNL